MFRHLLPALADEYRVIAPDHLGFGLSDAPPVDAFDYTFDALAALTAGLLRSLGVERYAMYVQDYGAPIGWRLALGEPERVTAIISQNGNAYDAGFVESFWKTVWDYQSAQTPETEAAVRQFFTLEATRWQYVTGVQDRDAGRSRVVVSRLFAAVTAGKRRGAARPVPRLCHEPTAVSAAARVLPCQPCAAVGGMGSRRQIFGPAGAEAFAEDLPDADIHLLDGGHFLLESALDEVTTLIRSFLARQLQGV